MAGASADVSAASPVFGKEALTCLPCSTLYADDAFNAASFAELEVAVSNLQEIVHVAGPHGACRGPTSPANHPDNAPEAPWKDGEGSKVH